MSQQQRGFGEVRSDDVGAGRQFPHTFNHLRVHGFVKLPVISEHRIDYRQRRLFSECGDKIPDNMNLFGGTKKAGIDVVEVES